jgi:hypothetical protein
MIVLVVHNPMEPGTWQRYDTDDLARTLREAFPTWPSTGRIYDLDGIGDIDRAPALIASQSLAARDVTPADGDTSRLERAAGPLLVTVPPADPLTAAITVAVTLAAVAIGLFLMPKPPTPDNTPSASKSLSDRSNKPRPGQRIEDPFGTVRAVPSLLSVPYRRFENGLEVEIASLCVGRGQYDLSDVRDGDTLMSQVAGAAVEFYGPNTSPNSGDEPQLRIGGPVGAPLLTIVPVSGVNGQLLRPPNANHARGDDDIRFVYPDRIETKSNDIDFTKLFDDGDQLSVSGADFSNSGGAGTTTVQVASRFEDGGVVRFESFDPSTVFSAGQTLAISNAGWAESNGLSSTIYVDLGGSYPIASVDGPARTVTLSAPGDINDDWDRLDELDGDATGYRSSQFSVPTPTTAINLAGVYPVLNVAAKAITLSNPRNINAAWDNLQGLDGGATAYGSPSLSTSGERWVGPFKVDLADLTRVITNFVGLSGLYAINKKGKQSALQVNVLLELTPVDSNDDPRGPAETFPGTLIGSATDKDQVGITIDGQPTFSGACTMRARRTSPTDLDYEGTLVDDVKWRDAVGAAAVTQPHFGNVTTVMAKTYATSGATSVKERKLNLRARRRVPQRLPDGTFSESLVGSDNMADIIAGVSLDPYIGARTPAEVDFDLIYDTSDAVAAYFGSTLAREFSFIFDDDNTSFEETLQTIAQACFCQAYRQGSKIRIEFERATEDSALLFNHRNVLPDSQTRTTRFGILDDQDGVELSYIVPKDGAQLTITLPAGKAPASPRTVELSGISTYMLGWWQAQRAWNKMRYQHTTTEFEATEEAAMVLPQQRVLIADMTRPDHLSGEVIEQDGVELTLTDDAVLDPDTDYTMFLQLPDATVQAIAVSASSGQPSDPRRVTLASPPRLGLITDPNAVTRTVYSIARSNDVATRAFLVSEREPNSDFTELVRAVNYTFLYYQHDQLLVWMPFIDGAIRDESAWQRSALQSGDVATVNDVARGHKVYTSAAGGRLDFAGLIATPSYTKSAWFNLAGPTSSGGILAAGSTGETFGFDGAGGLTAGHGAAHVSVAAPPVGEWHQVTLTYDEQTSRMALYLDGLLVGEAAGVARGSLGALAAFDGVAGRFDELRFYPRALSPDEVKAVYMGTR